MTNLCLAGLLAATVAAAAVSAPRVLAAAGGVAATRAEVQIELCSSFPDIARSLKLRPEGDPFEVWLFDDAAFVYTP